jgi:hypothetical protein
MTTATNGCRNRKILAPMVRERFQLLFGEITSCDEMRLLRFARSDVFQFFKGNQDNMKENLIKLAKKYGTPLFIIDHQKVRENHGKIV